MKPHVVIYNAVSLDSRFDWFTPDIGLFYEQVPRWNEDATLVGSETLLNPPEPMPDDTEEDIIIPDIDPNDKRAVLVAADSRGRFKKWNFLRKMPYWKDFYCLCSQKTPKDHIAYLERRKIKYLVAGNDHVDYTKALELLNKKFGIKVIRIDSGGTLCGILLRLGLVDEVNLLVHPVLVGGISPKTFFKADDLKTAEDLIDLKLKDIQKLKNDIILLSYDIIRKK
jgi:2,5-diamino-6-(ribosylamino)-4(3H)-pyrimidinone 5'-phosphate reductase